tara:strand:+ start:44 stop:472 length:429 start_codon:yes stop_codon:yes gene_type:complete
MAGRAPLVIDSSGINHSVPDHFQDIVIQLNPQSGALADVDDSVLYYAERDTVVDAAFITASAADGDQTLQLKRLDADTTDPDSAGTAFSNAQVVAAAYTPYTLTITETENFIPAGSMVAVNVETDGTAGQVTIQLRIRTRVG